MIMETLQKEGIPMWGDRSFREIIQELLEAHRGKVVGVICGLIIGLLIIIFGFWKSVFIIFCILIGYFLGKRFDDNEGPGDWWERFFDKR